MAGGCPNRAANRRLDAADRIGRDRGEHPGAAQFEPARPAAKKSSAESSRVSRSSRSRESALRCGSSA